MNHNQNMAGWISQFPNLTHVIKDPRLLPFFQKIPCPLLHEPTLDAEWNTIISQIGPLEPEYGDLTG